jgi:hypothetical protein
MGVEARCCPCHSTAHPQHMKRQPSLCHCHRCRGRCHCDRRRRLRCRCCLHRRCCQRCRSLLPSPLPSAIAVAVAIAHHCRHLFCVAVSHRCYRHPHRQPLPSLSPLAIAVTISIGHHHCHRRRPLPRVVALAQQELYSKNLSNYAYHILFCLDSWWHTDQSQMTDQALSGDGQHQHWAASGEQQAANGGSGW